MIIHFKAGNGACDLKVIAAKPLDTYPEVIALLMQRYNKMMVHYAYDAYNCTQAEANAFRDAVNAAYQAGEQT
jgi:hypothetical protein